MLWVVGHSAVGARRREPGAGSVNPRVIAEHVVPHVPEIVLSIKAAEEEGNPVVIIVGHCSVRARRWTGRRVASEPRIISHEKRPRVGKSMIRTVRGFIPPAEQHMSLCFRVIREHGICPSGRANSRMDLCPCPRLRVQYPSLVERLSVGSSEQNEHIASRVVCHHGTRDRGRMHGLRSIRPAPL